MDFPQFLFSCFYLTRWFKVFKSPIKRYNLLAFFYPSHTNRIIEVLKIGALILNLRLPSTLACFLSLNTDCRTDSSLRRFESTIYRFDILRKFRFLFQIGVVNMFGNFLRLMRIISFLLSILCLVEYLIIEGCFIRLALVLTV